MLMVHHHNVLFQGEVPDSTRGARPVCFGRVITHSTIVSNMFDNPIYRQTLFVSSIPNILLV